MISFRIGVGYDIHRLAKGRRLVLGGVEIPFDRGPEAHSDGDVLCHAVMDSLLGAAGLGDIGQHFPNTDEFRAADSMGLLDRVLGMLRLEGYAPVNVDATIIAEEPALWPHLPSIRDRLSKAIGAPVSMKATTNEGIGALGRCEALAVIAVSLISKE